MKSALDEHECPTKYFIIRYINTSTRSLSTLPSRTSRTDRPASAVITQNVQPLTPTEHWPRVVQMPITEATEVAQIQFIAQRNEGLHIFMTLIPWIYTSKYYANMSQFY